MGKELASQHNMQRKAMHYIAPAFWLVSASLAVFQYLIDVRPVAMELRPLAAMLFEIGAPLSLALFFFCNQVDPGKVPSRMKGASGVEDMLQALKAEAAGTEGVQVPDFSRLCTTTWVIKGLRTKYCTETEACVQEFDHFCGWLNVAIGRGNHRPFFMLSIVEVCTQLSHLYLCWVSAAHLVRTETFLSWIWRVIWEYPFIVAMVCLH